MPPKLYSELASWWPLVSAPADYAEEAEIYSAILEQACGPREVLELGSGGGNTASHLKARFRLTLVDRSADMLAVSRALNPECAHVEGDMRSVRLGRTFDAVFIHDALGYLTTADDLARAIETAAVHCRAGGCVLLVPDCFRETFRPTTDTGGHDENSPDGRGLRYLEWTFDPDSDDDTFETHFAFLLRERDGTVRAVEDHHLMGLFARERWLAACRGAGLAPEVQRVKLSDVAEELEVIVGRKGRD